MKFIAVEVLKELKPLHFRILQAIEWGMRFSEYSDVEEIAKRVNLHLEKLLHNLDFLHKKQLVERWSGDYVGYRLTFHGYDCLALNALYERRTIESIGLPRGLGKESNVYHALSFDGEEVLLKIHRIMYTSFSQVRKKREYTSDKHHISELYASRISAETEYKYMKKLYDVDAPIPRPIDQNRHMIVMEQIPGVELFKAKIKDPSLILEQIVEFMAIAWQKAKLVHGDLSEHNILVLPEQTIKVIDFPQAVPSNHKTAEELLKRDVKNINDFFQRKFRIGYDETEVLQYIKGETSQLS